MGPVPVQSLLPLLPLEVVVSSAALVEWRWLTSSVTVSQAIEIVAVNGLGAPVRTNSILHHFRSYSRMRMGLR